MLYSPMYLHVRFHSLRQSRHFFVMYVLDLLRFGT